MTDLKIGEPASLKSARSIAASVGRPLLVVAEEVSPEVVASLLSDGAAGRYLIVHPPEYGHWRKALLEDMAILTGGRVIARDLGGRVEDVTEDELGGALRVKTTASLTAIIQGEGDPAAIRARRAQVQRLYENAPPNIEQDKLRERLAKLSGGTAILYAGGVTPVEQKRTAQLIEDALNAVRAAAEDGVVAGGGAALAHIAPSLEEVIANAKPDVAAGARLVQSAVRRPLWRIVTNAGADGGTIVAETGQTPKGTGYNAAVGYFQDMFQAGVVDPVRVTTTALANAASVATLILHYGDAGRRLHRGRRPDRGPNPGRRRGKTRPALTLLVALIALAVGRFGESLTLAPEREYRERATSQRCGCHLSPKGRPCSKTTSCCRSDDVKAGFREGGLCIVLDGALGLVASAWLALSLPRPRRRDARAPDALRGHHSSQRTLVIQGSQVEINSTDRTAC